MTEPHDNDAGELIAADGRRRYPAVTTMKDLILMLGDGQFDADSADKIREFSTAMEEMGIDRGMKIKGKITLHIDVERERDGVYFFTPQLKFSLPPEIHGRTIGWVNDDNSFTPNKPNQGNLFGTIRDVSAGRNVRDI